MVVQSKCILVSLDDNVGELRDLAESLDFEVNRIFIQHRDSPNPRYYIGTGKAKEVKEYIQENNIEITIFNSALKPSQQYNLENLLEITVYDRIRLILEIFVNRAHSEEARLQVELAKLQYEIPVLRDWIHKARYGERPGFMAGGEYEVAQYYEISRKRIKKIKQKLKKVEKEREIRRKQRKNLGYHIISIVGYTNAGKSTLFNLIAGEKVAVEDKLFTTLSTKIRKLPTVNKPILLTDTVGLIDNLPHWIIEAFHSTLEEIFLSDMILLILDISETTDEINRKLKTSFDVLLPDINPSNITLILNKFDKLKDKGINLQDKEKLKSKILDNLILEHNVSNMIFLSAINRNYRNRIIETILKNTEFTLPLKIEIPNTSEAQTFINWLHINCDIDSIKYQANVILSIKYRERDKAHIMKNCVKLGGKIL